MDKERLRQIYDGKISLPLCIDDELLVDAYLLTPQTLEQMRNDALQWAVPRPYADMRAKLRAIQSKNAAMQAAPIIQIDPKRLISSRRIVEQRAVELLAEHNRKNPEVKLTLRKLADLVPCKTGVLQKTDVWAAYNGAFQRENQPKPKGVALTGKLEATKGADHKELQRLIAEHTADFEDSPLISNARNIRRRTKV